MMRNLMAGVLATVAVAGQLGAQEESKSQGLYPIGKEGTVFFQATEPVEGVTANELFSRAKTWAAKAYVSAKDVIQLDDRDSGRLILKGNIADSIGGSAQF